MTKIFLLSENLVYCYEKNELGKDEIGGGEVT